MNREQIEDEIAQLLADFTEQFERAKNFKSIPQIEQDLMLTTVREMYQQLYNLSKTSTASDLKTIGEKAEITEKINSVIIPDMVAPPVIEQKVQVVHPEAVAETIVAKVEKEAMPIIEVENIIIEELTAQEEVIVEIQVHQQEQEVVSVQRETIFQEKNKATAKSVASLFDDTPTIGDHYAEQQSLHHIIGTKKTERLSDQFQQPVGDLKRSIGINEKFAFMNELFGGNQKHYNEAIEKLNDFSDYDAACLHLDELAVNLSWNTASGTFLELGGLIRRRFGV